MRYRNVTLVIVVLLVCSLFWVWLFASGRQVAQEGGPMENLQALCLAVGAGLLIWAARRAQIPATQFLFLALALFFVSFLVREIEVEDWNLPRWLEFLLDGKPRNIWVGTLWLVLFVIGLRHPRPVWDSFVRWIRTPAGNLLLAGGVAYALSWPVDKGLLSLPERTEMFVEELLDTVATLLMLFSAIATLRNARQ